MAEIIAADREKSLFLTQIKFLDEQLERCQLQCDELQQNNKDLRARYGALEKDSRDIREYLKLSVAQREQEVQEVERRLERQQQVEQEVREALRLQHGREEEQLQEQVDELQALRITSTETSSEEQQEQQQEQLQELQEQLLLQQADLASLQQQLTEEALRAAGAASLESDSKARLLQERRAFNASVNGNIRNAVQQERAEHGELREAFQLLLEENEHLWRKKTELQWRGRVHIFDRARKTRNLHTATKQSATYRKEEEQQTERRRRLQEELRRSSRASGSLQAEGEALRERLASACEQRRQKAAEAAQLSAELQRESSRRRRLEGVTQEGVTALRHILRDSRRASEAQWRRLLELLQTSVPHRPEPQSAEPGPHRYRANTPSFSSDPLFLMARYRPGDLGLVPRPSWSREAQPDAAAPSAHRGSMFLRRPAGGR